jgi:hypothetical protein
MGQWWSGTPDPVSSMLAVATAAARSGTPEPTSFVDANVPPIKVNRSVINTNIAKATFEACVRVRQVRSYLSWCSIVARQNFSRRYPAADRAKG